VEWAGLDGHFGWMGEEFKPGTAEKIPDGFHSQIQKRKNFFRDH
jgi:hypothetical protein